MHPILLYLLKMMLCSGILYGYYRVALYNERFHQWNRFYLLGAMLLSVILPFVEIPVFTKAEPTSVVYVLDLMPWNYGITATPETSPLMNQYLKLGLTLAIGIVSLVLLFKLAMGIVKMLRQYKRDYTSDFENIKVIFTQEPSAPYSFFNWLFWRTDMDVESPAGKRMLQHELAHIRQKHSMDKLLVEIILVFGWINPFFWLIRKELFMIHEFLADQNAIERNNGAALAEMILQSMHIYPTPVLSNPFFTSQIKRRLFMITSSHINKFSYLKRLLTLCIAGGTIFLVACTAEKIEEPVDISNLKNLELPNGTAIYLDGNLISKAEMKNLNPDLIAYGVMLSRDAAQEKYGNQVIAGAYELFSIPTASSSVKPGKEHLPSFPGGKEGWTKYLQKNLRYPDVAIDNGTMGVAKIAFTVTPDGSIKDLKIIENPGDGLGEEALRIISQGPKWVPGKVKGKLTEQRVMLPITYRLE
jgi:TonB family protein